MTETQTVITADADTVSTADSEGSVLGAVAMGVLAMVLIYILTAKLQTIAGFVDKILGRDEKLPPRPSPERVEEEYKVYDIYEGEMNLDDNDKLKENKNG